MEIIKFLIVGKEKDYGRALCKCSRNLDINVSFSYSDNFDGVFSKYSMIIFDGVVDEEIEKIKKSIKCPYCYLTEMKEKESVIPKTDKYKKGSGDKEKKEKYELKEKLYVYKYKQLTHVITDLMDIFTYFTGNSMGSIFSGINNCKMYSVTSSMGGVGSTSIAMGLAKDMAYAGGNRTLYLSLGEYHQELNFAKGKVGKDLREYLYDFFYGNRIYCENIQSYLNSIGENLFVFNISEGKSQFLSIDEKQFAEFATFLMEKNLFDRIIVDIGTNIREKWNVLYKISNCNILINSLIDSWYQEKFWMEFYKTTGKINEKTLIVENRTDSEFFRMDEENSELDCKQQNTFQRNKNGTNKITDYFTSLNSNFSKEEIMENNKDKINTGRRKKNNKVRILEDKKAFMRNDGIVNINLDSSFGQGIREIVMALADLNKIN